MEKITNEGSEVKIQPRFTPEQIEKIEAEMVIDHRPSRGNMVERLVFEALQARAAARKTAQAD